MNIEDNAILTDIVVRYWNASYFRNLSDAMHLACHACWDSDEELSDEFLLLCAVAGQKALDDIRAGAAK